MEGGICHATCRGNARGNIFMDGRDRERLLARLAESQELFQVRIHLYCLMIKRALAAKDFAHGQRNLELLFKG